MIPDIAVGAIVAAIIGAMISLAGLIVAKESKVSEFRQAWIDSLRKELAIFVTNINFLSDANVVDFRDDKERFEKLSEPTSKLNESYYSVAFRLNISESSASAVQSSMIKLAGMATNPSSFDVGEFNAERVEFIKSSNMLLKDEWKRVKAGERAYRWTRTIATSTIGLLMAAIAIILAAGLTKKRPPTSTPAIAVGRVTPTQTPRGSPVREIERSALSAPLADKPVTDAQPETRREIEAALNQSASAGSRGASAAR